MPSQHMKPPRLNNIAITDIIHMCVTSRQQNRTGHDFCKFQNKILICHASSQSNVLICSTSSNQNKVQILATSSKQCKVQIFATSSKYSNVKYVLPPDSRTKPRFVLLQLSRAWSRGYFYLKIFKEYQGLFFNLYLAGQGPPFCYLY